MKVCSGIIFRGTRPLFLMITVAVGFATWNIYWLHQQIPRKHRNNASSFNQADDIKGLDLDIYHQNFIFNSSSILEPNVRPDLNHQNVMSNYNSSEVELNVPPNKTASGEDCWRCNRTCKERHNIAFVKLHKVGGSTVMNILQRFGERRNLTFVLSKHGYVYLGWGQTLNGRKLMKPLLTWEYNLLVNHVMYNRTAFRKLMPRNTTYVTIIRHPFEVLVSAVEYLMGRERANEYLKVIPGDDKVLELLRHPLKYEPNDSVNSFTNNRMAYDLGIPPTKFRDQQFIQNYIHQLDKDFSLIMLLERFDESLVLMKRYLCWSFKDIIYSPMNINWEKPNRIYTREDRNKHREWAIADYMLYDYFQERFQRRVASEGTDFFEEVKVFKSVVLDVQSNCRTMADDSTAYFEVKNTDWNESFNVTHLDCQLMTLMDTDYIVRLWKWQIDRIKDFYRQLGLSV